MRREKTRLRVPPTTRTCQRAIVAQVRSTPPRFKGLQTQHQIADFKMPESVSRDPLVWIDCEVSRLRVLPFLIVTARR